jgi:hypothetical protein
MATASSIETARQPAPLLELTFPAELIDRAKVVQIAGQHFNTILQSKYKADIRLNFFKGFLGQGVIFVSTAIFTIDTIYILHSAAAALISIFLMAVAFVGFSAAHAARK